MPPVPVALHVGKVHLLRSTINASRRYAARHLLSLPITNHVLICYHVISACIWQARFGTWLSGTRTINTPVDGGTWHQLTHSGTQSLTHVHTHSVPALWDYKYHRIKKGRVNANLVSFRKEIWCEETLERDQQHKRVRNNEKYLLVETQRTWRLKISAITRGPTSHEPSIPAFRAPNDIINLKCVEDI